MNIAVIMTVKRHPLPFPSDPVVVLIQQELLDEAAAQQNIILQTSQALNVCDSNNDIFKGSQEEVEAERVLLLACEYSTFPLPNCEHSQHSANSNISTVCGEIGFFAPINQLVPFYIFDWRQ